MVASSMYTVSLTACKHYSFSVAFELSFAWGPSPRPKPDTLVWLRVYSGHQCRCTSSTLASSQGFRCSSPMTARLSSPWQLTANPFEPLWRDNVLWIAVDFDKLIHLLWECKTRLVYEALWEGFWFYGDQIYVLMLLVLAGILLLLQAPRSKGSGPQ